MGTIRRFSDFQLASIGTTKVYSVSSNETVYIISSGNRAIEITNYGVSNLIYGQSSVLANSGSFISSEGSKFWDTITDNFSLYLAINSLGTTNSVVIQEYPGA